MGRGLTYRYLPRLCYLDKTQGKTNHLESKTVGRSWTGRHKLYVVHCLKKLRYCFTLLYFTLLYLTALITGTEPGRPLEIKLK